MKLREGSVIATQPRVTERQLAFVVTNGQEGAARRTIGELVLDLTKVSAANLDYAAFHGFKQRIADKAALSRDEKSGKPATPEEKLEAMRALVDYYNSGAEGWSPARSAERVGSDEVMIARALQELNPLKPAEEIRRFVAGMDKAARGKLRQTGRVKELCDKWEAERVSSVDVDAVLIESGLEF